MLSEHSEESHPGLLNETHLFEHQFAILHKLIQASFSGNSFSLVDHSACSLATPSSVRFGNVSRVWRIASTTNAGELSWAEIRDYARSR